MVDLPDLAEIRRRMSAERLTQTDLAAACGLTQPHLSKVLTEKVPLTGRTAHALADWLARHELFVPDETLLSIGRKLRDAPANQRMQIMQLLRLLDGLIERPSGQGADRATPR